MAFVHAASAEFSRGEIAIAITHGAFGSHAGIAFHSSKEGTKLLHLQFHKRLAVESFPPAHCWIATRVDLPALAAKQLVGIVRAIAQRRPTINYAVDCIAARGSFDSKGHYSPPKGSKGLTCATFVSEIFRAARLPLIAEGTWTADDNNIKWANDVCDLLAKHGAGEEHVNAVKASINGLRVRPEEIGAASNIPFSARPLKYDIAPPLAAEVMKCLHGECPLPDSEGDHTGATSSQAPKTTTPPQKIDSLTQSALNEPQSHSP